MGFGKDTVHGALPLPYEGKEVVFNRPSGQVKQNQKTSRTNTVSKKTC